MDPKPISNRAVPGSIKARRGTQRKIAGLTPVQIFILGLVTVLGMGSLAWVAGELLSPRPRSAILAQSVTPRAPDPTAQVAAPAGAESEPAALIPPAACAAQYSEARLASGARVIDSRTMEVQVDGETLRIGLAGLAVPTDDSRSNQVLEIAASFATDPPLLLVRDISQQDEDGRLLRYIFSGDRFLNLDLVRLGLAQADLAAPDRACLALFQQAEQQARAERIGMWQPAAVPTATFMPFVTLDPSRQAPCDCLSRPTCAEFRTRAAAQACYNACNDYNSKLDWDRDGLACEELP